MKKFSVVFVFLLVGIFLFSLNFGSAGCNSHCPGGAIYNNHDPNVCHSPPAGNTCSTQYCLGSQTITCVDNSGDFYYCIVPNNPLNCQVAPSCSSPACVCGSWTNSSWSSCNSSSRQNLTSTRSCSVNSNCASTSCNGVSTSINYVQNCTYVPPSALSKPFFAKLNAPDVSISSVNLGDTVLLRFPGASLNGTTINYSLGVYNASGANWWNPFSYFTKAWDNSQKILGTAYEPFTITQTDLHRFNASIVGINRWNASDNISIISGEDSYSTVNVLSSLQDIKAQNGSAIWFNQSSSDEDDLLQITWDFGDGQNFTCSNYSAGIDASQCNVQHAYANKGVYLASLSVKGMNRGSTRSTSFFVYSFSPGINVVPIVSSPEFGTSNGNFVNFNASASFVANCSASILNGDFTANNLNCTYIHAPNKPANQSLNGYNLTFSWNMDGSIVSGNWSNYNSAVVFNYYFLNSGAHNTHLNLIYSGP